MKKLALAAIVATTLASSFSGTAVAGPEADGPFGFLCGFSSITNPQAEANTQTGEIDGGPLVAVDAANNPQSGTLHCTIQVGANSRHANTASTDVRANDAAHVSASGSGVIVIPPTVVSYTASPDADVWLCSEFVYSNGTTVYYHADNDDDPTTDTGHWSSDKTSECGLAISASTPEDPGPIGDAFDLLNATVCPVLLTIPEVGDDLAVIWEDCEDSEPIFP